MPSPELTIVLPTFNEAANIPVVVERIGTALKGIAHEIIVVDDDSPDGTYEVARELASRVPELRCIRRVGRRGLSGACLEGMMAASAPVVAVMDADLQHDEKILVAMLDQIRNGADLVIGTRYADGGSASDGFNRVREWGSRTATWLAGFIVRDRVSDPMSGFFMLRRPLADRAAKVVSRDGFKILFDIVARFGSEIDIREVPFTFGKRTAGESKLGAFVTAQFLGLVFSRITAGLVPAQFLLFALVGLSGLVVHMGTLFTLTGPGSLAFPIAQTGATVTAMTWNFIINNNLTYAHKKLTGWNWILGLLSFYAICSLGAIANVSISVQVYEWRSSVGIAGLAGALMSSVFNYSVTKLVTWRDN